MLMYVQPRKKFAFSVVNKDTSGKIAQKVEEM